MSLKLYRYQTFSQRTACLGPCPLGKEGKKVTCPKGKSTRPGRPDGYFLLSPAAPVCKQCCSKSSWSPLRKRKLLAQRENLLVLDDRTGIFFWALQPPSANNAVQNQVGRPSVSYELASKRTQQRIRNKLKTCARQKVAELKTEVENMGASYEEICQEILEGQFDGVRVIFIFSIKTFLFSTHMVKFHYTYSTLLVGFPVYLDWQWKMNTIQKYPKPDKLKTWHTVFILV